MKTKKKNRCAKFVKVSKKKTSQSKYAMCVFTPK